MNIAGIHNAYFLGIGGIGMSALASYLFQHGIIVSGYDKTPGTNTSVLEKKGIRIVYSDDTILIPSYIVENKKESVIVYTPAIPENHKQLIWFRQNGYSILKRSELLGIISAGSKTMAIAGTHGKTTTTTALAHIMSLSEDKCTAFLGGISKNYHSNLVLAQSQWMVVEADEYDRSFLTLNPKMAVITAIDADHLDIYGTISEVEKSFHDFVNKIQSGGFLVVNKKISFQSERDDIIIYTYSIAEEADFYLNNIQVQHDGYHFDLVSPLGTMYNLIMSIPGRINLENLLAASALATLSGVTEKIIREALQSFAGVERRFDVQFSNNSVTYIDDYAHHPAELESFIRSVKERYSNKHITGIFQPHLYSRTRDFSAEFAKSLDLLDSAILLDIYPAREIPIEGISSSTILDKMELADKRIVSKENLLESVNWDKTEILVTMGAGDIDRLVKPIKEYLVKKYE